MAPRMPDTRARVSPAVGAASSHVPARLVWPIVGVASVAMLALRLAYALSDAGLRSRGVTVDRILFEEVVGALAAVPYLWAAVAVLRRWPLHGGAWPGWVARLVLLFAVGSLLHAPLLFLARGSAAAMLGLEGYGIVPSASEWLNEALNDVLPAVATIAGMTAAEYLLESRARERQAFALERSLLEAELRNVRLQLQPHFLFNALNTISATMYEDPAAADALLTGLSDLLRASLRTTEAQEVPLRDEVALVEQYVRLMQARFPGALRWDVTCDPGVDDMLVPSMSLQPLVENAVRHGALATRGRGAVQLTARLLHADGAPTRGADRLELRVHDDGPGSGVEDGDGRGAPVGAGTGLSATRRRLALLYGSAGTLEAGHAPGGGFTVRLCVPARRAPGAAQVPPRVPERRQPIGA